MSKKPLAFVLALMLFAIFFVPTTLFVAPPTAHANDYNGDLPEWLTKISDAITATAAPITANSTLATQIKGYVLDPLAHALAQAVLKAVVASVVNSINGKNGSPQFVTNLAGSLQSVGDRVGLSFIAQFASGNNSPFAPAISSSLKTNYAQQTSLAGFFASNQCTLNKASPNINSFLAGNWSQGGAGAWFALTTQNQNNPFTLQQAAQSKLYSLTAAAQANQRQTIAQNNGFFSWCSSGSADSNTASIGKSCTDFANSSDCSGTAVCVQNGTSNTGTCEAPTAATSDDTSSTCYNKDGTPGTVQTPGSILHDTLSKATGSSIDSLVSVQNFNQLIDSVFAALTSQLVSTTLAALSGSSSSGTPSITSQLASSTTATDPNSSSVASQAASLVQTTQSNIASYTGYWQTIQNSANVASTSVHQLASQCASLSNDTQNALITEIAPVFTQASYAFNSASTTQALATQVTSDTSAYTAGTAGAGGSLAADTQALAAAPPTSTDLANAESQASVTKGATSTSAYVLTVSGGTLVDQMNLINTNAQAMLPYCGPPIFTLH